MAAPVSHRRGEHVRRTVLAAAFDELADSGVANASVAGVARRSGVHETTIYRRWVTRENLFVDAMLSRSAQEFRRPYGTIRGDLLAIAHAVIARGTRAPPSGTRCCTRHCYRSMTVTPKRGMPFGPGRLDALRDAVQRGIDRGELRADTDPGLLLEMLVAPLHGRLLLTGEPLGDGFPERLVDLVLHGAAR